MFLQVGWKLFLLSYKQVGHFKCMWQNWDIMQVLQHRTVVRMWFGIFETHTWLMLFLWWENTCISFSITAPFWWIPIRFCAISVCTCTSFSFLRCNLLLFFQLMYFCCCFLSLGFFFKASGFLVKALCCSWKFTLEYNPCLKQVQLNCSFNLCTRASTD